VASRVKKAKKQKKKACVASRWQSHVGIRITFQRHYCCVYALACRFACRRTARRGAAQARLGQACVTGLSLLCSDTLAPRPDHAESEHQECGGPSHHMDRHCESRYQIRARSLSGAPAFALPLSCRCSYSSSLYAHLSLSSVLLRSLSLCCTRGGGVKGTEGDVSR
jgi:hypothetical protein